MYKEKQLDIAMECIDTDAVIAFQAINGVPIVNRDTHYSALSSFLRNCADGIDASLRREKKDETELQAQLEAAKMNALLEQKQKIEKDIVLAKKGK